MLRIKKAMSFLLVAIFAMTAVVGCSPKQGDNPSSGNSSAVSGENPSSDGSDIGSSNLTGDTSTGSGAVSGSDSGTTGSQTSTGNTSSGKHNSSKTNSNTNSKGDKPPVVSTPDINDFDKDKKTVFKEEKTNLGGMTITIASPWNEWEKTADSSIAMVKIDKALREIERDYNCKIKPKRVDPNTMIQQLQTDFAAGRVYADILEIADDSLISTYRYLQDVTKIKSLNLKTNTWVDFLSKGSTFKGTQYGVGYMMTQNHAISQMVVVFNKTLAKQHNVGDLYEVVRKGQWTYDKFLEVSKKVKQGTNGKTNGLIMQHEYNLNRVIYTNDFSPIAKDKQGYYFDHDNPNMLEAMQFWSDYNKNGYITASNANDYGKTQANLFVQKKAMFYIGEYIVAPTYFNPSMGDYGILPLPKGPSAKGYTSVNGGKYFTFPYGNKNVEAAGKILVAIANRTGWDMKEWDQGQLETALTDEESLEMMHIMLDAKQVGNGILEMGLSTAYRDALYDVIRKNSKTPAQAMQDIKSSQNASINQAYN